MQILTKTRCLQVTLGRVCRFAIFILYTNLQAYYGAVSVLKQTWWELHMIVLDFSVELLQKEAGFQCTWLVTDRLAQAAAADRVQHTIKGATDHQEVPPQSIVRQWLQLALFSSKGTQHLPREGIPSFGFLRVR